MKFLKHRVGVFVVMRQPVDEHKATVVGVFEFPSLAYEFAGACEQEWIDNGGIEDEVSFVVTYSTFYA